MGDGGYFCAVLAKLAGRLPKLAKHASVLQPLAYVTIRADYLDKFVLSELRHGVHVLLTLLEGSSERRVVRGARRLI